MFSLSRVSFHSSPNPGRTGDCRLDMTACCPSSTRDIGALRYSTPGPGTTAPSGPLTESPADVGRDEAHPVLPVFLTPLSEKPVTEKHATGTHALCSEVHASTGCAGRHSALSVVALPLTLWRSILFVACCGCVHYLLCSLILLNTHSSCGLYTMGKSLLDHRFLPSRDNSLNILARVHPTLLGSDQVTPLFHRLYLPPTAHHLWSSCSHRASTVTYPVYQSKSPQQ